MCQAHDQYSLGVLDILAASAPIWIGLSRLGERKFHERVADDDNTSVVYVCMCVCVYMLSRFNHHNMFLRDMIWI